MADDKKAKKEDKPKDEKPKDGKAAAEEKPAGAAEGAEGGEGGAVSTEVTEAPKKALVKKIILFGVLPVVLLMAIGGGAYFTGALDAFLPKKPLNCENVKEGDKEFAECEAILEEAASNLPGTFLNIPDMIVNLNSNTKQPRFLKVSLKLELGTAEDQAKITPLLPRVVDQFQMYLRELRIEDLRGTSGIYRMKIELLSRVRAAAPTVKVRDVLFQEILVQ